MRNPPGRYANTSDQQLVELVYGNPLGADGVAASVEMQRRFRASSDRWSQRLTVLTIVLIVLTAALVVIAIESTYLAWVLLSRSYR